MRAPVGRPPLGISIGQMIWAYVELMCDQQNDLPRLKVRAGCRRLHKSFSEDLKGGRILPFDTIRRHYKAVDKDLEAKAAAMEFYRFGRDMREQLGWHTSPWMWLMNPDLFTAKGYTATVHESGNFTLKDTVAKKA
jgi:hypothetical protein